MTNLRMALLELLSKYKDDGQLDALREGVRLLAQALMELEVSEEIGAERYQRTKERKTYRNGYRKRRWDTRVGTVQLKIPKLRKGSYFPSLLEPRRRAERALLSVIQEAYVQGVSTRKVDELVKSLGLEGISKSEVSRICEELDEVVERFRNRPLTSEYPYVWLDAKVVKVRQDGRVVPMAAVVAIGVRATGEREVLGFDVWVAESYEFWLEFLRSLVARGLKGVRLVDLGRAWRPEACPVGGAGRGELAAVPGALHAGSALTSTQARPGRGDGVGADDLRPTRPRDGQKTAGAGGGTPGREVPQGGGATA